MANLKVIRSGMLTTIQDLGRWGYQASGVPVAGPMDLYSHRLANRLVGNEDDAAALEITMIGPEIEAVGTVVCAVAGAEFEILAGGRRVPPRRAFELRSGARLRVGQRIAGARATIAVRGGLDVPPVLGSRATSLISRMGPFGGRALEAGDVLPVGTPQDREMAGTIAYSLVLPRGGARLRVIAGPHAHHFPAGAMERLLASRYVVTAAANRMGYRLEGASISHGAGDLLSDATPAGSVQVPGSGQPILLMADRQTTGGYPRIATVISADLPIAAQLAPGDWIEFWSCTRAEALLALSRQEAWLAGRLQPPDREPRT